MGWEKYFFKHNCLPYAFVHNVEELLEDYNDKFGTNYEFKFTDYRDSEVMNRNMILFLKSLILS